MLLHRAMHTTHGIIKTRIYISGLIGNTLQASWSGLQNSKIDCHAKDIVIYMLICVIYTWEIVSYNEAMAEANEGKIFIL